MVKRKLSDDHSVHDNDNEWFQEFQSLTKTLFTESTIPKECSHYIRRELTKEFTRLPNEVTDMPESDDGFYTFLNWLITEWLKLLFRVNRTTGYFINQSDDNQSKESVP